MAKSARVLSTSIRSMPELRGSRFVHGPWPGRGAYRARSHEHHGQFSRGHLPVVISVQPRRIQVRRSFSRVRTWRQQVRWRGVAFWHLPVAPGNLGGRYSHRSNFFQRMPIHAVAVIGRPLPDALRGHGLSPSGGAVGSELLAGVRQICPHPTRRISFSTSAKIASKAAIVCLAGVVRSSASVSETKPMPRCCGSSRVVSRSVIDRSQRPKRQTRTTLISPRRVASIRFSRLSRPEAPEPISFTFKVIV